MVVGITQSQPTSSLSYFQKSFERLKPLQNFFEIPESFFKNFLNMLRRKHPDMSFKEVFFKITLVECVVDVLVH